MKIEKMYGGPSGVMAVMVGGPKDGMRVIVAPGMTEVRFAVMSEPSLVERPTDADMLLMSYDYMVYREVFSSQRDDGVIIAVFCPAGTTQAQAAAMLFNGYGVQNG